MVNSKQKGNRGEREWAKFLREHGFDNARRGQQYNGLEGDDVVGLPGVHNEVKRVEKLQLYPAMDQSIEDAKDDEVPIVAHRRNRKEWVVVMRAEDFIMLYNTWSDTWMPKTRGEINE